MVSFKDVQGDKPVQSSHRQARAEPVKVGVIGTGRFGENHVRAYAESPLCELVAVADVDRRRAEIVAARYGVAHVYDSFQELLANPEIAAVSIATPAHQHAEPALAAAHAGKHILIEKPIAMTLADGVAMVEAAHANHVKLMVGHTFRFEINFAGIYEALREGTIGRPIGITARLNNPITEARYVGKLVSPILHNLIHLIDLALWYVGELPQHVYCVAARGKVDRELQVPDGCLLSLEFENGAVALLETFWCLPEQSGSWSTPRGWTPTLSDLQIQVICTEGALYGGGALPSLRAIDREGWKFPQLTLRPTITGELGGAFREEIKSFLTCCTGKGLVAVDGHAGLRALQVALAAETSLKLKMPIEV